MTKKHSDIRPEEKERKGNRAGAEDHIIDRLHEEGKRYRDLFDHSPIGIYRTSIDGRILLANPALVKMLKYDSLEDLLTIRLTDTNTHIDNPRSGFVALFDDSDEVNGLEYKWVCKDGSTLHVRENVCAVRDENGKILYFDGTVEDVTEKKRAEMELQTRFKAENLIAAMSSKFANAILMEERWGAVLEETLKDAGEFVGADTASIIVSRSGSQSIKREFSWSKDPATVPLGEKGESVLFEEQPWAVRRLLRNEMVYLNSSDKIPEGAEIEYKVMSEMGLKSIVMAPWVCTDRTVGAVTIGLASEVKDWPQNTINVLRITAELVGSAYERRISYEKWNEEQRLVRALMNNSPDRIYFKDRQCRFIRANRALCELHGIKGPSEITGKTDKDLFTAQHAEEAMEDDMRVMSTGVPVIAKEELETWSDGKDTWASTTKLPMYDEDGNVSGLMGISRDITSRIKGEKDRRRLELQMMQAQKMESLGVMCGGIAHDFNNFLMGILGNTGLALMEMAPESPAWSSVKQIETVALRAAELTNQLLAYSGKTESERRIVHLSKMVKEMAHLLRVSIPQNIDLSYEFEGTLPGIDCDPVQVRQVVMNLMINASDSIEKEHGRIEVETGADNYDADFLKLAVFGEDLEPGEYVYLKISDNGEGMDEKTMEKVFDPFFTTKPTGHGLGMAVVMGVIKAHKGAVVVESQVGKGTSFTVLFPSTGEVEKLKDEPKRAAVKSDSNGTVKVEILIVEDDEIVRNVSRKILENCGFIVVEACDGTDAIKLIEDSPEDQFGLIMLDVTLPGASGKEVLEKAKEIKKDVPIILMSGYNEDIIKTDYGISGYNGFLKKPFDAVTMTELVKECCNGSDGPVKN